MKNLLFQVVYRNLTAGLFMLLPLFLLVGCAAEVDGKTQFTETPSSTPFPVSTEAAVPATRVLSTETPALEETDAATPTIVADQASPTSPATAVPPTETAPATATSVTEDLSVPEEAVVISDGGSSLENAGPFTFAKTLLAYPGDNGLHWARAGDMDNDGDLDIVAGGYGLYIYENDGSAGGWLRYGDLDSTGQMGGNGAVLFDVDKDGYLDVVSAKKYRDLGWWKNPGGALKTVLWEYHVLGKESWYMHDIILADLDKDGKAEEFIAVMNSLNYWDSDIRIRWFRPGPNVTQLWETHTIEAGRNEGAPPEGAPHGHSGIDVGDIDKDGNVDVGFSNGWYEAPDDPASSGWIWHELSIIYGISNNVVADIDGDNDLDLVVSGGHHGQGAFWLENDGSPASGAWPQHDISAVHKDITKRHRYDANAGEHLHHPECLAAYDMDGDGDLDVVTCELWFGEADGGPGWDEPVHDVHIYENLGGGQSWQKQTIIDDSYPSHLLQLYDVNEDGKMDIVSTSSHYANVNYFENRSGGGTAPPTSTPVVQPTDIPVSPTATTMPKPTAENYFYVPFATST